MIPCMAGVWGAVFSMASSFPLQSLPFAIHDLQAPRSHLARPPKRGNGAFLPPGGKLKFWDQPPASHPAQSRWPNPTRRDEPGNVFRNQFGTCRSFGRRDTSGSIQSCISTWIRPNSSHISKDQAVFVPALSHHHILLDGCPSPEPIPVLQA